MTLSIKNLTKSYRSLKAVDSLTLEIEQGQVFGLLGPNGSGKTTTLGMLTGVILPDSGSYQWFGDVQPVNARKKIGTLLETPNFYPYLNAIDNLKIVARIKGAQTDYDAILKSVNLYDRRHARFETYSLGMKQRLAIAGALIGNPEVLIFDEPTNGLDPQGIAEVRQVILDIAQSGKTIILASHILDEVEKICSHVAIIKQGKLLSTGSVGSILNNKVTVEVGAEDLAVLKKVLENCSLVERMLVIRQGFSLTLKEEGSVAAINQYCFDQGIVLSYLIEKQKSLEQEFLEITQ